MTLDDFISLPKAELHRHIDGSVPASLVRRLGGSVVESSYHIGGGQSINELLAVFNTVLDVMQTPVGIETVFYECTRDLAEENIYYVEWTFCPLYHSRGGMSINDVIESAKRGLDRAFKDSQVFAKLIPAINREGKVDARSFIKEISRHRDVIAGIGLACNEADYPIRMFSQCACDIDFIPHAGEMGNERERNILDAVDLGAKRIGHAIPAGANPLIMDRLRNASVHVELNPLSNLKCGFINSITDLGLDSYLDHGVRFSINSDDPVLLGATLSENFLAVFEYTRWNEHTFDEIIFNTLLDSGMNPSERAERMEFFRDKRRSLC